MSFNEKKILVVGASSGIGRQVALHLDSLGAETILVARRENKLLELKKELKQKSICIPFDLSRIEEIEKIFLTLAEKGIKLDGLVYSAGICEGNLIKNASVVQMQKMLNVNLLAFYMVGKYFYLPKYSNKGSCIVAISSISSLKNEPGMSSYSISKGGMNLAVQVMAKEFLKRKLRVNAVLPAQVMSKMACEDNVWKEEEISDVEKYQPLGVIPIDQVVNCVEFLLSNKAAFITGECISISGGYKEKN